MPFFLSSQGVILWSWKFAFKIRWRNFFWAGLYAQGFYCDLNCWTGSSWIDPNYFQKNPAVKVKKNQEDTLHSIPSPSPSVKIQNMGGKICWSSKGKTFYFQNIAGFCQKTLFVVKNCQFWDDIVYGRPLTQDIIFCTKCLVGKVCIFF